MPRDDPAWALFLSCSMSHVACLPSVFQLMRRRWMFETYVCTCALIASFMYHTCEALGTSFFLNEGRWHRLDNIGVLSCFGVYFTYLCNFRNIYTEQFVKYSTVALAIVAQEKDPWNELYTFGPMAVFIGIPLFVHGCVRRKVPAFDVKSAVLGFGLLVAAVPFFLAGLDDGNDPYRMYHGLWHVVSGAASFFMWRVVVTPQAIDFNSRRSGGGMPASASSAALAGVGVLASPLGLPIQVFVE
jgi:hypothetical protein